MYNLTLKNAPIVAFLASQALYGIMIAYPNGDEDDMIEKAFRMAEKMRKRLEEDGA